MYQGETKSIIVRTSVEIIVVQWQISDFPIHLCSAGEKFDTEPFTIADFGYTRWKLEIYPKGCDSENPSEYLSLCIRRLPDDKKPYYCRYLHKDEVTIDIEVERLDSDILSEMTTLTFKVFDIHRIDTLLEFAKKSEEPEVQEFIQCRIYFPYKRIPNGIRDYVSLSNDLRQLYLNPEHFDVILACEGKEHKVHRNILTSRAGEFVRYLDLDSNHQAGVTRVNVTNIPNDILTIILTFIYTGAVDTKSYGPVPQELCNAGELYGLNDLCFKLTTYEYSVNLRSRFKCCRHCISWTFDCGQKEHLLVYNSRCGKYFYCDEITVTCQLQEDFSVPKETYEPEVTFSVKVVGMNSDIPICLCFTADSPRTKIEESVILPANGEWTHTSKMSFYEPHFQILALIRLWDGKRVSARIRDSRGTRENYYPLLFSYCDFFKLSHDIHSLFEQGLGTDFQIICEGEEFQVHKSILAARSSYFSSMLSHDMKETRERRAFISDISAKSMKLFLTYLYRGTLPDLQDDQETLEHLYSEADKCNVEELKHKCHDYFEQILSARNYVDIYRLAKEHSDEVLMSKALEFEPSE